MAIFCFYNTWVANVFPCEPKELRLKLLPVLEWTTLLIDWGCSGVARDSIDGGAEACWGVFGVANPVAEAGAATNVDVEVFEPLNGDILKPDRLIERLKESNMASTWIMAVYRLNTWLDVIWCRFSGTISICLKNKVVVNFKIFGFRNHNSVKVILCQLVKNMPDSTRFDCHNNNNLRWNYKRSQWPLFVNCVN